MFCLFVDFILCLMIFRMQNKLSEGWLTAVEKKLEKCVTDIFQFKSDFDTRDGLFHSFPQERGRI